MTNNIVTVSQLCRYAKALLDEQPKLKDLLVRGEIANISLRSYSGHLYFTLRDGDCSIRCVMFRRYADNISSLPEDGSAVVVRGAANIYERDGSFQLLAYDLQELGEGRQQQEHDEAKKRLAAEGVFAQERKRPLPPLPKAVGIITSPDGAALHDIISTFAQHNPLVKLIVYPASVQGESAPKSLCAALKAMVAEGLCQSCVISRGGGSSEDLSAFNDEVLVRAVAECPVPVVSAVGHEVDFSLLDLAADARASTPTAACRLLAIPVRQLRERVNQDLISLQYAANAVLEQKRRRVDRLSLMLAARSPAAELKKNRQTTLFLIKSLEAAMRGRIDGLRRRVLGGVERLDLVNPTHLLRRGYTITSHNEDIVTRCEQVAVGDRLTTRLVDGCVISHIELIREEREE